MIGQLLISGIAVGSIYALLGLALVLIHKATDVVNFAQGEMSMFSTFLALAMLEQLHLPLWAVLGLAFPVGAMFGAIIEIVFIRPMAGAPPVNLLIVTTGLFIVFNNLAGWIWGFTPYKFPSLFSATPITVVGVRASPGTIGVIAIALVLMAGLYVFFEKTREGTAMRAASQSREAARLMGINVRRVSTMAWALAGGIGMVSGMLVAPLIFLDNGLMVPVLLKAFAGAIMGGFNSLPGAILGGLFLGVAEVFFAAYVSTAFTDSFAFLIIIAVLMFRPNGLFTRVVQKV
jgi:branched-chain amino acid transport system permease protein